MKKRFDIGGAVAAITPVVYQLYLDADNTVWDDQDGTIPTTPQWLLGFNFTPNAPLMAEVGLCVAAGTGFVPKYPKVYCAAGVPVNVDLESSAIQLAMDHATINKLAIRLSVAADATVKLSGTVNIAKV